MINNNDELTNGISINKLPIASGVDKQEVKLLVGSFDAEGNYYNSVLCSQLTGKIRREFSKPSILNNPGKLVTAVLVEALEFPHKPNMGKDEKKLTVRGMYSADRAWCIFAIRNATTNNPIEIKQICPGCEVSFSIYTKPDELKYYKIEDTNYKLDKLKKDYIFNYKTTWGEEAIYYLSRGINEEEISLNKNIAEATHTILATCLKYLNSQSFDPSVLDDWGTGKTDELFETLLGNQPGPETIMEVKCPECNRVVEYGIDPADFLLPSARRRQFRKSGGK
jgi:hypothetical protein